MNLTSSPFKFLDSYAREDREIFFGREREIEEMYQKIFDGKILLLYGVSGTGKTSLINCGLANKFEDSDWLPVTIRRGRNILDSLKEELNKVTLTPLKEGTSFNNTLQSIYLDHFKPIYLIFDQFEELFIFGEREERDEFIQIVQQIVSSEIQCKFIFSVREEYLASITEFETLIDDFLDNRMRVEKMTRHHAIEVIEGPCRVHGIKLDEGFADILLNKLNPDAKDVELTFLQIFLDRIYRLAAEDRKEIKFTNEIINKTGDVSDLLGSFLEDQIRELDDPDGGLALLKAFVSVKGTKRQIEEEEMQDYVRALGKNIPLDRLVFLVQNFVNLRILRDKDENGRYELRHDSLAAKIFEKITLVEKELLEIKQFIDNAFENFEKRGILLGKEDLDYVAPYENKLILDKKLGGFLDQCHRSLVARKRSFRRILLLSFVGFVVVLLAIGIYSFRYSTGLKAENMAMLASIQQDFSLPMSFNTAKTALETDPNSTYAVKALFDAFYGLLEGGPYYDSLKRMLYPDSTLLYFTPTEAGIARVWFSEDGSHIFGYLENNRIIVWDRCGDEIFSGADPSQSVVDLVLSPDNKVIAAVYDDSTASLWNISGQLICTIPVHYEPLSPTRSLAFLPNASNFAITGRDNNIEFYESNGTFQYSLSVHSLPVTAISISPDGQYLASSSRDSTIVFWSNDNETGRYQLLRQLDDDFRDVVWSVEFAMNSKYVISACNDSLFDDIIRAIILYSLNGGHDDINWNVSDTCGSDHWHIDEPVFDARFTAGDAAIISTNKGRKGDTNDFCTIPLLASWERMEFSLNSKRGMNRTNKVIRDLYACKEIEQYSYSSLDMSVYGLVATNIAHSDFTTLTLWDNIPLRRLRGSYPVFSPDGNYLLCINSNSLSMYPASADEIIDLVDNRKIFGALEENMSDWRNCLIH